MRNKYFHLFILSPFLLVIMQSAGWGEVRNVYEFDGATGIQDSIDVSGAGDTVLVHDGIYYVRDVDSVGITMRDSIVLMSAGGAESCTLSGLNSTATDTAYHVIYCSFGDSSSHTAMIRGFTITNGHAPWPHDCGGGIYCYNSSPTIDSCVIENNSAFNYGGGIFIYWYSSPTITNSVITNNSAEVGGGIFVWDYSLPIIANNTITNNLAHYRGGGLSIHYHYSSSPIITDNMITNNLAHEGGGLSISCSSPVIANNTIINNSAEFYGGGIFISNASPTITGNTITNNLANSHGGGFFISYHSSPTITGNTIANNVGRTGGAIYDTSYSKVVIDSCFIVGNGSFQDIKSGLDFIALDTDILKITHSHIYYNTFQPGIEIYNNTSITIPLENNFWWDTTEAKISGLIEGPADFTPWEYDFIPGVPGEPVSIDSVRNYTSNYSQIIDSVWDDPDTLYLRIYGEDRNARFREAAVAIIKSSIYPSGIAVALIETDTSSGIYKGKAIVKTSTGTDNIRTDDIYQTVRVDSLCDSLQIVANMDTAQKFVVYYKICPGVEEDCGLQIADCKLFQNYPNPFTRKTVIRVRFSCSDQHEPPARITIYDLSGRLVKSFPLIPNYLPLTTISWDGKDKDGKKVGSGVYFYKLEAGDFVKTKKMFLIR